jgi:Na+/proline symporter
VTSIDFLIIFSYLAATVAIGIVYRGKQDDTRDYFTSHRGFGGMIGTALIGLSIAATLFSGLSFVAFPSIAFTFGITVLSGMVVWPLLYVLMRFWFLPRYLAVAQTSPYEIIERRFGISVRITASAMFVACRLCWMSAVIYVPALLLTSGGLLDPIWFWPLVALIGISSTLYTVIGGIRGVIITDAVQMLLITFVLIATIACIALRNPLSLAEVTTTLQDTTRLLRLDLSFSLTAGMTVWGMMIGSGVQTLCAFASDPMLLQRYLAASDPKSAASAVGTSMVAQVGVLVMLALVGLTLGTWYLLHPDPAMPANPDQVFYHFMATQMPAGFVGLFVAAVLAATMSSVTSGINALSGSLLSDFVPLAQRMGEQRLLRLARVTSAIVGIVATLGAGLVKYLGTVFNMMNLFYGIFLGPMLGCMLCAISSLRIDRRVLIFAMVMGCLAGAAIGYSPIANIWVSFGSCAVTLTIAIGSTLSKSSTKPAPTT